MSAVSEARQLLLYWSNHPEAEAQYDEALGEEAFLRRAAQVSRLHMFMHNCPSLAPLCDFPSLRELVVTLQTIPRLEGLHNCAQLERLVLTEVKLEAIAGLRGCRRLRQLDLSRNRIRRIAGLEALGRLETLWLNENQIERVEGLRGNTRLRTLWLARNRIAALGESLDACPQLRELNVAANQIAGFRDVANLARLTRLRALTLTDPHYGPNPVCALYNYTTYCLYHLPQLSSLDQAAVPSDARVLAEGTYGKKLMYYSMRIKAAQRLHGRALQLAQRARLARAAGLGRALNALLRQRAGASHALHGAAGGQPVPWPPPGGAAGAEHASALRALGALAGAAGEQLAAKLAALDRALEAKARELATLEGAEGALRARAAGALDSAIRRLLLELESGGNVRLEDGTPADVWHASCADLLHSRFCAPDFAPLGLEGVRAVRVSRVHNRALRARFDEALDALVEAAAAGGGSGGHVERGGKPALEFLFALPDLPAPRGGAGAGAGAGEGEAAGEAVGGMEAAILRCAEHGLSVRARVDRAHAGEGEAGSEGEQAGGVGSAEAGAPEEEGGDAAEGGGAALSATFTNSLALLDLPRLRAALPSAQPPAVAAHLLRESGALGGRLLVCKAHLGRSVAEDAERTRARGGRVCAADYPGAHSVFRLGEGEGEARQRRVFLFKPELVLPEYLLEFEYVARDDPRAGPRADPRADPCGAGGVSAAEGTAEGALGADAAQPIAAGGAELTSEEVGGLPVRDLGSLARPLAAFLRRCGPARGSERARAQRGGEGARGAPADGADSDAAAAEEEEEHDADCARALALPPALAPHEAASSLTPRLLAEAAERAERWGRGPLELLDFHASALRLAPSLGAPRAIASLRAIVISFNCLESLPRLDCCPLLQQLDVSFNLLRGLSGLDGLRSSGARLQRLDLSANLLHSASDVLEIAESCGSSLARLGLRGNALAERAGYRQAAIAALPALAELDLVPVTRAERLGAAGASAGGEGGAPAIAPTEAQLQAGAYTRHVRCLSLAHSSELPRTVAQMLAVGVSLPLGVPPGEGSSDGGDGGSDGGSAEGGSDEGGAGPRPPGAEGGRWEAHVEQLELEGLGRLARAPPLAPFLKLLVLNLSRTGLGSLAGVDGAACPLLRELSAQHNELSSLHGLWGLRQLRRLELGGNLLSDLWGEARAGAAGGADGRPPGCARGGDGGGGVLGAMGSLALLGVEDNRLSSLAPLGALGALSELYACGNLVGSLAELHALSGLPSLVIADLSGNPVCAHEDYRPLALYAARRLKVLDALPVEPAEQAASRERFTGLLTEDVLTECARAPPAQWPYVRSLDLSGCGLRELALLSERSFAGLAELSLASNQLSSLATLGRLPGLVSLSLAGNALGGALAAGAAPSGGVRSIRDAAAAAAAAAARSGRPGGGEQAPRPPEPRPLERLSALSVRLEHLDLSANQIADLGCVPLRALPQLRTLRLGSNAIARLGAGAFGEQGSLRELGLEKNRIRTIEPGALAGLGALRVLRLDENGLRALDNLGPLPSLLRLELTANRIAEVSELDKLAQLEALRALGCAANPVSRKQLYRPALVHRLPCLESIDGRPVSDDERERAEALFAVDARPPANMLLQPPGGAGGLGLPAGSRVALKPTSMSLDLFMPAQPPLAHGGGGLSWQQAAGVLGMRGSDGENGGYAVLRGARFSAPALDESVRLDAISLAGSAVRKAPGRPGAAVRRAGAYAGPLAAAAGAAEERARAEPRQLGRSGSFAQVSGRRFV